MLMFAPSPKFFAWLLSLVVLLASLVFAGQRFYLHAVETAYDLAVKGILSRANLYKENWIVSGRPKSMKINEQQVEFNSDGWLLPVKNGQIDCRFWFVLLNGNEKMLGGELESTQNINVNENYICIYSGSYYNDRRHASIALKVIDGKFSVNKDLSATPIN